MKALGMCLFYESLYIRYKQISDILLPNIESYLIQILVSACFQSLVIFCYIDINFRIQVNHPMSNTFPANLCKLNISSTLFVKS